MANVTLIDGIVPNYVNPATQVPIFLGVQISLTALALVVVMLRLYTRKFIRNILSIEDWVAAVAMFLGLVATIVSCLGVLGGTGLHYYDIPPTVNLSIAASMSFANQVMYQPTLQLTKISILLFYMSSLGQAVKKPCVILMVASGLFCVATTVVEFLQCRPAYVLWTSIRPAGFTCINQIRFFQTTGIINLILDVATLIIPLPVLWKLVAPVRTRLALCGIFSVGLLAIAAEVVRLVIWFGTSDGNRTNKDSSWNRVTIVNWSCVEYTAGIICASLPHLKALVAVILPGFFEMVMGSSKGTAPGAKGEYINNHSMQPSKMNSRQTHNLKYGNTSNISGSDRRTASRLDDNESEIFFLDTYPSSKEWPKVHSVSS